MKEKHLTTNQGAPVSDNQNSLTVGERGPVLLQDVHLIEKLAHFDRERIPERVVHAIGAGAHGYFQVHKSMAKYTCAKFLQDPKKKTSVFVRFSTVVGARGSAETVRDPRGFAVKFYTEDGNYDLVGNNLPVFFIRDAIKFPDMVHAFKPAPDTNNPHKLVGKQSFLGFHLPIPRIDPHDHLALFRQRNRQKFQKNGRIWRKHLQVGERRRQDGIC
jgi:catalase